MNSSRSNLSATLSDEDSVEEGSVEDDSWSRDLEEELLLIDEELLLLLEEDDDDDLLSFFRLFFSAFSFLRKFA